jgi:hypothetical protein
VTTVRGRNRLRSVSDVVPQFVRAPNRLLGGREPPGWDRIALRDGAEGDVTMDTGRLLVTVDDA